MRTLFPYLASISIEKIGFIKTFSICALVSMTALLVVFNHFGKFPKFNLKIKFKSRYKGLFFLQGSNVGHNILLVFLYMKFGNVLTIGFLYSLIPFLSLLSKILASKDVRTRRDYRIYAYLNMLMAIFVLVMVFGNLYFVVFGFLAFKAIGDFMTIFYYPFVYSIGKKEGYEVIVERQIWYNLGASITYILGMFGISIPIFFNVFSRFFSTKYIL